MAPVKITFSDNSATPPVYVAGSFTEWQAVELEATQVEQGFTYEKTFDLIPGTYQFKFRLGPGDWWTCDSQATTTRDAAGNENNEIVVKAEPVQAPSFSPVVPVVNGTSKPVVTEAAESVKPVVAPIPASPEIVKDEPVVTSSIAKEGPVTAKVNGVPKSAPEPVKPIEKVNGMKPEPVAAAKEAPTTKYFGVYDQVTSQHLNGKATEPVQPKPIAPKLEEPVAPRSDVPKPESSATSKPVVTKAESSESTTSSLPAKEKASAKPQHEPEKLSWFSRVFLCGSSRK